MKQFKALSKNICSMLTMCKAHRHRETQLTQIKNAASEAGQQGKGLWVPLASFILFST